MDISDIGFREDDIHLPSWQRMGPCLFERQERGARRGHVALLHHFGRYLSIVRGQDMGVLLADPGPVHRGLGLLNSVSGGIQHGLGLRDARPGGPLGCLGRFEVLPGGGFLFQEFARTFMGRPSLGRMGPG